MDVPRTAADTVFGAALGAAAGGVFGTTEGRVAPVAAALPRRAVAEGGRAAVVLLAGLSSPARG